MTDGATAGGRERRRWSRRRLLLLELALIPLLAVLAELGFRGWLALKGRPYDGARARVELLAAVDALTQPLPTTPEDLTEAALNARNDHVVHPYLGFDTDVGVRGIGPLVRSLSPSGEDDAFEVLVVGGSVSGMVAKNGAEALRAAFAADPRFAGREVVVRNQGRGAFKQPQQLLLVAWLLSLGAVPDAIVNVDGFNEVALGAENPRFGVHPSYPSWPRWGFLTSAAALDETGLALTVHVYERREEARGLARRALARGYLRSALLGSYALRRMRTVRAEWTIAQEALVEHLAHAGEGDPAKGPPFEAGAELELAACARGWMESSRNLHALCAARGIQYLHVLQPTLLDEGAKPMAEQERSIADGAFRRTVEHVRAGYPLLRTAGAELTSAGVPFLDLSRLFEHDPEPLYTDVCHFRPSGCARVGQAIGAALLAGRH